jgi:hypothetical protein
MQGAVKLVNRSTSASVLVLACFDPRFAEYLAYFLASQVWANYDLFSLAGASLGVLQSGGSYTPVGKAAITIQNPYAGGPTWPPSSIITGCTNNANWAGVFNDHLAVSEMLHGISEVWVFDHLDCSAYKAFQFGLPSTDDLEAPHLVNMTTLQAVIASTQPNLKFKGFLIRLDGSITNPINDGSGIHIHTQHVEKHNWTMLLAVVTLLFGVWISLWLLTRDTSVVETAQETVRRALKTK